MSTSRVKESPVTRPTEVPHSPSQQIPTNGCQSDATPIVSTDSNHEDHLSPRENSPRQISAECAVVVNNNNNNNNIETRKGLASLTSSAVVPETEAETDSSIQRLEDGAAVSTINSASVALSAGSALSGVTSGINVNSASVCKEPERIVLTTEQLNALTKEELISKWFHQDKYIASVVTKLDIVQTEVSDLRSARENEERLKTQLAEVQRKEQYYIMRLSSKENELQEFGAQIQELKSLTGGSAGLKHSLLDPAINLLFERLKRDQDTMKNKMEETQNELSAWKFTPDSNTGKQLMAKCRLLIKENEELGKMISSGRLAKLEGDLAMQRSYGEELKKSQSELNEFLLEMDEDTEAMQGTILYLQKQLRHYKDQIAILTTASHGDLPVNTPSPLGAGSGSHINISESQQEHILAVKTEPLDDVPCESMELTDNLSSIPNNQRDVTHNPTGETNEAPFIHPNGEADSQTSPGRCNSDQNLVAPPTHLTNGRKRTQSVLQRSFFQGEDDDGVLDRDVGDSIHDDDTSSDLIPPLKRTKQHHRVGGDGVDEGGGEQHSGGLLENGVTTASDQ